MVEFKEQYIPYAPTPVIFAPVEVSKATQGVLMRVAHEDEFVSISLIDSNAVDLDASNRSFCEIKLFNSKSGFMNSLAAPSFSGKEVILLVRKVMELASASEILFGDGSTILGCCEEGALTSLGGLEIFRRAKTWYMSQGASANVSTFTVARCNEPQLIECYAMMLEKKRKPARSFDFDQFRQRTITKWHSRWISTPAFLASCRYLFEIQIGTMRQSLLALTATFPLLASLEELLSSVKQDEMTLGELLQRAIDERSMSKEKHLMLHELRDRLVGHKDSQFFHFITSVLQDKTLSNEKVVYALVAIHHLDMTLGELCPTLKPKSILLDLLQGNKAQVIERVYAALNPSAIRDLCRYEDDGGRSCHQTLSPDFVGKVQETFAKIFEKLIGNPVIAKVLAHSTKTSREKWLEYRHNIGQEIIDAAEASLQYLACIDPHFLQGKPDEKSMSEFLKSCAARLSIGAIALFQNHTSSDVYPLFCLAKYLRDEKCIFLF